MTDEPRDRFRVVRDLLVLAPGGQQADRWGRLRVSRGGALRHQW